MFQTMNVPIPALVPKALSVDECKALLARSCFGHLAFARETHVDAVPIRFASVEGWLYFRADAVMRTDIAHNSWVLVTVTESLDATHVASVVARGACYVTEQTGSTRGDAAALRGILRLRDQPADAETPVRKTPRSSIVFRMHIDHLRGVTSLVPATGGNRAPHATPHIHRPRSQAESAADGARADDDGMREPRPGVASVSLADVT
jgi:nitroimidazol reductase NimA-like FMN-containing flavoprotein (pyridoxamine 5'-phosphate oxidase superfamily)